MLTARELWLLFGGSLLVYWFRLASDPRVAPLAGDPDLLTIAIRVGSGILVIFIPVLVVYALAKAGYSRRSAREP